jgi:hypothetical protein
LGWAGYGPVLPSNSSASAFEDEMFYGTPKWIIALYLRSSKGPKNLILVLKTWQIMFIFVPISYRTRREPGPIDGPLDQRMRPFEESEGSSAGETYTPLNAAVWPRAAHPAQSVCALNFGLWARPIVRFLKQTCCASFFFHFFSFSLFFRFTLTDCEFCLVQNFDKFQICSNFDFFQISIFIHIPNLFKF